ncbi:hypothetical protein H710_00209 [Bartonella bacilliformis Ver097]|uniref:LPS export ABC transporter periplasmic protein LptC n=2 Tax=Bartonella bacilliformis TaxID=774 RepID=A0A072R6J2_BARBA|nr:hypothetical protein H710_00209 [Bartonella bacilliformis Ver097]
MGYLRDENNMAIYNRNEIFSVKSSFSDVLKTAYCHSRRIHVLKIFLPLVAFIIALVFCWFTFFSVSTSFETVILNNEEDGITTLTMVDPRLEGYTSSNQPYWLKAEKAFQDHVRFGVVELENITAEVPASKQVSVFLRAQRGIYDNSSTHLQLNKPFTIETKDGLVAQFMTADINLSEGQLKTDQRVDIYNADFSLTASRLRVCEKGRVMHFQGGVHLLIN